MITVKPISHADITVGPSAWVQTHAAKIVPGGRVLDYACGSGRHALWFAQRGFEVVAIDRDQTSLDQITSQQASIHTENIDLESATWSLNHLGTFDAVVVT
ncbi:MAG: methyltransferase domain-containing protein, partial [Polynucleobacter victoriensis]